MPAPRTSAVVGCAMRWLILTVAVAALGAAQAERSADPTVELLRELIRIDTSNPPGHEGKSPSFSRRSSARWDSRLTRCRRRSRARCT